MMTRVTKAKYHSTKKPCHLTGCAFQFNTNIVHPKVSGKKLQYEITKNQNHLWR